MAATNAPAAGGAARAAPVDMDSLEIGTRVMVLGEIQKPGSIYRVLKIPRYEVLLRCQDAITGLEVPGTDTFSDVKESELVRAVCPCGKHENLSSQVRTTMKCGKCKKARYCSAQCQRQAWPDHKSQCRLMARDTPQGEHEFHVGEPLLLVNVEQAASVTVKVTARTLKTLYVVKMDHSTNNQGCQCGSDQLLLL